MWKDGEVEWNGKKYRYEAKVFDFGSMWGIGKGRVSKLWILDNETRKTLWTYDRGWNDPMAPNDLVQLILQDIGDDVAAKEIKV